MPQIRLHRNRHIYLSCSCQRLPETLKDPSVFVCLSDFPQLEMRPPKAPRLVRAFLRLSFWVECILKGQ